MIFNEISLNEVKIVEPLIEDEREVYLACLTNYRSTTTPSVPGSLMISFFREQTEQKAVDLFYSFLNDGLSAEAYSRLEIKNAILAGFEENDIGELERLEAVDFVTIEGTKCDDIDFKKIFYLPETFLPAMAPGPVSEDEEPLESDESNTIKICNLNKFERRVKFIQMFFRLYSFPLQRPSKNYVVRGINFRKFSRKKKLSRLVNKIRKIINQYESDPGSRPAMRIDDYNIFFSAGFRSITKIEGLNNQRQESIIIFEQTKEDFRRDRYPVLNNRKANYYIANHDAVFARAMADSFNTKLNFFNLVKDTLLAPSVVLEDNSCVAQSVRGASISEIMGQVLAEEALSPVRDALSGGPVKTVEQVKKEAAVLKKYEGDIWDKVKQNLADDGENIVEELKEFLEDLTGSFDPRESLDELSSFVSRFDWTGVLVVALASAASKLGVDDLLSADNLQKLLIQAIANKFNDTTTKNTILNLLTPEQLREVLRFMNPLGGLEVGTTTFPSDTDLLLANLNTESASYREKTKLATYLIQSVNRFFRESELIQSETSSIAPGPDVPTDPDILLGLLDSGQIEALAERYLIRTDDLRSETASLLIGYANRINSGTSIEDIRAEYSLQKETARDRIRQIRAEENSTLNQQKRRQRQQNSAERKENTQSAVERTLDDLQNNLAPFSTDLDSPEPEDGGISTPADPEEPNSQAQRASRYNRQKAGNDLKNIIADAEGTLDSLGIVPRETIIKFIIEKTNCGEDKNNHEFKDILEFIVLDLGAPILDYFDQWSKFLNVWDIKNIDFCQLPHLQIPNLNLNKIDFPPRLPSWPDISLADILKFIFEAIIKAIFGILFALIKQIIRFILSLIPDGLFDFEPCQFANFLRDWGEAIRGSICLKMGSVQNQLSSRGFGALQNANILNLELCNLMPGASADPSRDKKVSDCIMDMISAACNGLLPSTNLLGLMKGNLEKGDETYNRLDVYLSSTDCDDLLMLLRDDTDSFAQIGRVLGDIINVEGLSAEIDAIQPFLSITTPIGFDLCSDPDIDDLFANLCIDDPALKEGVRNIIEANRRNLAADMERVSEYLTNPNSLGDELLDRLPNQFHPSNYIPNSVKNGIYNYPPVKEDVGFIIGRDQDRLERVNKDYIRANVQAISAPVPILSGELLGKVQNYNELLAMGADSNQTSPNPDFIKLILENEIDNTINSTDVTSIGEFFIARPYTPPDTIVRVDRYIPPGMPEFPDELVDFSVLPPETTSQLIAWMVSGPTMDDLAGAELDGRDNGFRFYRAPHPLPRPYDFDTGERLSDDRAVIYRPESLIDDVFQATEGTSNASYKRLAIFFASIGVTKFLERLDRASDEVDLAHAQIISGDLIRPAPPRYLVELLSSFVIGDRREAHYSELTTELNEFLAPAALDMGVEDTTLPVPIGFGAKNLIERIYDDSKLFYNKFETLGELKERLLTVTPTPTRLFTDSVLKVNHIIEENKESDLISIFNLKNLNFQNLIANTIKNTINKHLTTQIDNQLEHAQFLSAMASNFTSMRASALMRISSLGKMDELIFEYSSGEFNEEATVPRFVATSEKFSEYLLSFTDAELVVFEEALVSYIQSIFLENISVLALIARLNGLPGDGIDPFSAAIVESRSEEELLQRFEELISNLNQIKSEGASLIRRRRYRIRFKDALDILIRQANKMKNIYNSYIDIEDVSNIQMINIQPVWDDDNPFSYFLNWHRRNMELEADILSPDEFVESSPIPASVLATNPEYYKFGLPLLYAHEFARLTNRSGTYLGGHHNALDAIGADILLEPSRHRSRAKREELKIKLKETMTTSDRWVLELGADPTAVGPPGLDLSTLFSYIQPSSIERILGDGSDADADPREDLLEELYPSKNKVLFAKNDSLNSYDGDTLIQNIKRNLNVGASDQTMNIGTVQISGASFISFIIDQIEQFKDKNSELFEELYGIPPGPSDYFSNIVYRAVNNVNQTFNADLQFDEDNKPKYNKLNLDSVTKLIDDRNYGLVRFFNYPSPTTQRNIFEIDDENTIGSLREAGENNISSIREATTYIPYRGDTLEVVYDQSVKGPYLSAAPFIRLELTSDSFVEGLGTTEHRNLVDKIMSEVREMVDTDTSVNLNYSSIDLFLLPDRTDPRVQSSIKLNFDSSIQILLRKIYDFGRETYAEGMSIDTFIDSNFNYSLTLETYATTNFSYVTPSSELEELNVIGGPISRSPLVDDKHFVLFFPGTRALVDINGDEIPGGMVKEGASFVTLLTSEVPITENIKEFLSERSPYFKATSNFIAEYFVNNSFTNITKALRGDRDVNQFFNVFFPFSDIINATTIYFIEAYKTYDQNLIEGQENIYPGIFSSPSTLQSRTSLGVLKVYLNEINQIP